MEQFFAEYAKVGEKVFEEESSDEEEKEEKGKDVEEDVEEDEYVCALLSTKTGKRKDIKSRLIGDMKEILDVVDKERSQVADIMRTIRESEGDKSKKNLAVMFLVQSGMRDSKEVGGEWLYAKINEINSYVSGTDFDVVPTMLKGLFQKCASYWTPQDLSEKLGTFPTSIELKPAEEKKGEEEEEDEVQIVLTEEEIQVKKVETKMKAYISKHTVMKKSKNGFPELGLPVTSKVINQKRVYPCPLEGCSKAFISPRTCDAHINRHLGYEYGPCGQCGYTNASRDSYDKHKCFSGLKTGGDEACVERTCC